MLFLELMGNFLIMLKTADDVSEICLYKMIFLQMAYAVASALALEVSIAGGKEEKREKKLICHYVPSNVIWFPLMTGYLTVIYGLFKYETEQKVDILFGCQLLKISFWS